MSSLTGTPPGPISLVPIPVSASREPVWPGARADSELVVADALTMCTASATRTHGANALDGSLQSIQGTIGDVLKGSAVATWRDFRGDATRNLHPITGVPTAVSLATSFPARYELSELPGLAAAPSDALQTALDVVGVNLCMARSIEEQMKLGAVVLLTGADQRALVEEVRERAQLAMLYLADIFQVLSVDGAATTPIDDATATTLRAWSTTSAAAPTLASWAADLTDAIRLHTSATTRLAKALVRASAAHELLPGGSNPSPDDFAPGGYRHRVLALLYGGDPLASTSPGNLPRGVATKPASTPDARLGWPSKTSVGGATPNKATATGAIAEGLARRLDVATLQLAAGKASYTSPDDIDAAASAAGLFHDMEVVARTLACTRKDAQGNCVPSLSSDVPLHPTSSDVTTFRIYKDYGIRPEDARVTVDRWIDVLPSATDGRGLRMGGGVQQTQSVDRAATLLKLAVDARFLPRGAFEMASAYARLGRHRLPYSLASDGIAVEPLFTGRIDKAVLDGSRTMGAVPALATVRTVVQQALSLDPASQDSRGAVARALGAGTVPQGLIAGVLGAALGPSQVTLQPVEAIAYVGGAPVVAQPAGNVGGASARSYRVTVTSGSSDEFWSSPAGAYSLVVTTKPWRTLGILADLSADRASFGSLSDALSGADGSVTMRAFETVPGGFVAVASMPVDVPVMLIVRRRSPSGITYRALTSAVTPWVGQAQAGGVAFSPPVDTQVFAPGGEFDAIAERTIAPSAADPGQPAFDGFGFPRSLVPSTDVLIPSLGHEPMTMLPYINYWLEQAKTKTDSAQQKLNTLVDTLTAEASTSIKIEDARAKELADVNTELQDLCGQRIDLVPAADTVAAVQHACGIEDVEIHSLGSPQAELQGLSCDSPPTDGTPVTIDFGPSAPCIRDGQPGATTETQVKCLLDALAVRVPPTVHVAKSVACGQYAQGPASRPDGKLGDRIDAQYAALQELRSAVVELNTAGALALAQAREADQGIQSAMADDVALQKRMDTAKQANQNDLADLTEAVKTAHVHAENVQKAGNAALSHALKVAINEEEVYRQDAMNGFNMCYATLDCTYVAPLPNSGDDEMPVDNPNIPLFTIDVPGSFEIKTHMEEAETAEADARAKEQRAADLLNGPLADEYRTATSASAQHVALAHAGATTAATQAQGTLSEKVSGVLRAIRQLVTANNDLRSTVRTSTLTVQRAVLEAKNTVSSANESFGITLAFHADAAASAHAAAEDARALLLTARRAVEYALVTDLSSVKSLPGQSLAPAQWADQVFDDDLSPLGSRPGHTGPGWLSVTKFADYKSNLATAGAVYLSTLTPPQSTTYLANQSAFLPGPAATHDDALSLPPSGGAGAAPLVAAASWAFECPSGSKCAPTGGYCPVSGATTLDTICASADGRSNPIPLTARYAFDLDAWGQPTPMSAAIASEPSQIQRFRSARWARFAINFVSDDPLQPCGTHCARLPSIVYTLRHLAPLSVTDSTGAPRLLPLDTQVLTGMGVASVQPVDLRTTTLDSPFFAPGVGTLYVGSPLLGSYELVVSVSDDGTDLRKVTGLQVVFDAMVTQ